MNKRVLLEPKLPKGIIPYKSFILNPFPVSFACLGKAVIKSLNVAARRRRRRTVHPTIARKLLMRLLKYGEDAEFTR